MSLTEKSEAARTTPKILVVDFMKDFRQLVLAG